MTALSFFPQLVAGPILRARDILPQFHKLPVPTWVNAKHAFLLITVGLMKKTTADLLAVPAKTAFDSSGSVSLLESWTGVLAFAGQIYGDFSGYSDMAIGIALLLGFQIPSNFHLPYLARSPVDFWRRWHISLSTWLRDYLYISLGGNRTGHRTRNVLITMLLGGLWHGAAWTFVAWGAFHGIIIVLTHALAARPAFRIFKEGTSVGIRLVRWGLTFYLVLLGWVLFRATSLSSAWDLIVDLHTWLPNVLPPPGPSAMNIAMLTGIALILMHGMDAYVLKRADRLLGRPWVLWPLLIIGQALCLLIGEPSSEFIYFQF